MTKSLEKQKELSERLNEESHLKQLIEKLERGLDLSSSQVYTPDKSFSCTDAPKSKTIRAVLNDDRTQVTLFVQERNHERPRMM